MKPFAMLALAIVCIASQSVAQNSPFAPPRASLHYAPDRTCDLQHLEVHIDVDYANRVFTGTSTNTLSPLRSGISQVKLHAGAGLDIKSVELDGRAVSFTRDGRNLLINTGSLVKGKPVKIAIAYSSKNARGTGFGQGGGGFHWIAANAQNPNHVGFWTQGESEYNSEWAPTWDYPNDLTTSETFCTVPADWDVVGNGVLADTKSSSDKKTKTFHWKMTQPHATYLLSLVGGPFDIKKDKWEGVDLWYVVPKGEGYMIDDSFGHTKDMLSFFSGALGVKYAWPKYAQNAMFDFGGGMENVSATTLGENSLTEARDGYYTMDSLNSHELGHQWFGDLVTCKDWGDTWLNESFATFMEVIYMEHSRGRDAYDWEVENNTRSYLAEARRYHRPISTKMYPNADAMFDSHTYPKGGTVLHTLRRWLGDENFFAGLNYYLTKWRHTPVESAQLRRSFTEATGIDVEPFWAQWFEKPGHPVLEYTWKQDGGDVVLDLKQTQDTSDGTPIYEIPAHVGLVGADGKVDRQALTITGKEQTIRFRGTPTAVLLDPDHDFLREMKHEPADSELMAIIASNVSAPDRAAAMAKLLASPTDANVRFAVSQFNKDNARDPAFRTTSGLAALAKPELRNFWLGELGHPNFDRRAQAVAALAKLPSDPATVQKLRSLITDKDPISVVVNSINALAAWDKAGNADIFRKARDIKDRRGRIKRAAETALQAN
jgi:aminopeptidase N